MQEDEEKPVPGMDEMAWQDYVLSQFEPEEMVEGLVKVAGLRRVVRKLLGPTLKSVSKVIEPVRYASYDARLKEVGLMLAPVTVEHTVVIKWHKDGEGLKGEIVEFTAAADVYLGNTTENFARHATAVCSTKAEAIALRKLLMLQKVIAFEEKTDVPISSTGIDGKINDTQMVVIKAMCQRNNINVEKFVNSGSRKYENLLDVPYDKAAVMLEQLDKLQNDRKLIKDEIKGYDPKSNF